MTETLRAGLGLAGFALWWFVAIVYMDEDKSHDKQSR